MKPFAIYFPQFYPIDVNDQAWGHGFTDWMLVAYANAHRLWQQRAPRRGYYDGADREVHREQLRDMRNACLGGVALYHYWFGQEQLLGAFERTLLDTDEAEALPWFLIWACESWSRRWVGDTTTIVSLSTRPTDDDIARHCDHVATCMARPSYWRLDGKPLFVWYHLAHFENSASIVGRYREQLRRRGFDVAMGQFVKSPLDVRYAGLVDVNYLFEPRLLFSMTAERGGGAMRSAYAWLNRVAGSGISRRALALYDRKKQSASFPAAKFVEHLRSDERRQLVASLQGRKQEIITPGWNNTPRYQTRFTALENLDASLFAELVAEAQRGDPGLPPLVNAWNEWSEGAAIEPCAYLGSAYIDALARTASDPEPRRTLG